MTRRNVVRIVMYGAVLVVLAWIWGYYDVYGRADKACTFVRSATSRADADALVRKSGGVIVESGGRSVVTFSWLGADVLTCSYRFEQGKVVEFTRGAR